MLKGSLRNPVRGLAAVVAFAFIGVAADGGLACPTDARAETSSDIAVGQQLEALSDVTLARAEIAKGSRVNVTKVLVRQGRLASIDVELADGMVARVAITVVRESFRVVSE